VAGGSLPRGGKASYFRRLSEHVPQNIRTRVTEFIESVVFKEELEEITASVGKTVVPHEHEGKYATVDHTHASATHTHGWPTKLSQMKDVSTLNMAVDHLLFATAYGSWVVLPPQFDAGLFGLFDEEDDTKTAVFDLSAITSGEERTISTVDAPMTIPPTADWLELTDGHDTTLHTHQHELLYGIGYYDHAHIDNHLDDTDFFHDHGNLVGLDDDDHPQYPNKTGWASPATSLVTLAFNDGTREFTLTPTGASFDYWIQGVKYTKTTPQTVTITDTYGAWFIYFDGDTLTASQTPWGIVADDKAFVALIYWDADANEAIRVEYELHGWMMDAATHEYLHDTFGTRWEEGLAVGINGDNLDITAGELHDEDLQITITDSGGGSFWEQDLTPASLPILYRSGASGLWKRIAASTTPCYLDTNVLQINVFSGGSWTWAPVTVNQYCAYWVVASSDINEPVFLVAGQEDGATLTNAQDGNSLADMAFGGLPSAEHKVVARVIVRRVNGAPYYDLIEVADYRDVSDEPSGTAPVIGDHGSLTGLTDPDHPATAVSVSTTNFAGILSVADTLVQTALDTIDDHLHDGRYYTETEIDTTLLGYLPLTAGSTKPLTGDLYIDSTDTPSVYLREGASATAYAQVYQDNPALHLESIGATSAEVRVSPKSASGGGACGIKLFADTTTTAISFLGLYDPDGAGSTLHHFFECSTTGNVDLCQQSGNVTIGGSGGAQKLTVVNGNTLVNNGYGYYAKAPNGVASSCLSCESGLYQILVGASGLRTRIISYDGVKIHVPSSAIADANMEASYVSPWVDETNHRLYFKVKYSDGTTVKSGYISLS
jgi:hypothetical protein